MKRQDETREAPAECRPPARPQRAAALAQAGALLSAVAASACCWLPLTLLALGVSGGSLAAGLASWRPVLLPVTFVLLALAFYFTYRRPRLAVAAAADQATHSCCATPSRRRITLRRFNKATLWVAAAVTIAFALFPSYVGYLVGQGSDPAPPSSETAGEHQILLQIDGMSCEACAVTLESSLSKLPGVDWVRVDFEKGKAQVGLDNDSPVADDTILQAVTGAGGYTARILTADRSGTVDRSGSPDASNAKSPKGGQR